MSTRWPAAIRNNGAVCVHVVSARTATTSAATTSLTIVTRRFDVEPASARTARTCASRSGAGKRAFRAWLDELVAAEAKDEQLKSPLVLTVFFGELVPASSLKRSLLEHRLRHERNLARLRGLERAMAPATKKRLPATTVARGLAYQELCIRFIDDALALL